MPIKALSTPLHNSIYTHNMAYLMLARELLKEDFTIGMLQLGISSDVARKLVDMPIPYIIELAHMGQLVCRFSISSADLMEWSQRPAPFEDIIKAQRALHLINPVCPRMKRSSRHPKK